MTVFLKKLIPISLILIAFFSIINIVLAQESILNSISSVNLNISPSNPRAGDSVTIALSSDSLDLDSSKITWYIDEIIKKESTGKNITIKTKVDGKKTSVRAVVETLDGIVKEVSGEISPVGVDLIIEPMSYTMPFYKGKPLFIKEGVVKIIAMPDIVVDGVKILPGNANYKWFKDDYVLGSNSGRGNNSIVITSTIPVRDSNVRVEISDDLGNILAETSKIIVLNDPQILFYEDSPLYGVLYNKAIVNGYYLGTKEELKVVAKPFSFSFLKDVVDEAAYAWYANGNIIPPSGKNNQIILKQTTNGASGVASMSLDVSNTNKINQFASRAFDVQFGQ